MVLFKTPIMKSIKNIKTHLSPAEIARLYSVSTRTLYKWISPFKNKIGERNGRYYTIRQVYLIYHFLGWPESEL